MDWKGKAMKSRSRFRNVIIILLMSMIFSVITPFAGAIGQVKAHEYYIDHVDVSLMAPIAGNKPDTVLGHYSTNSEDIQIKSISWSYYNGDSWKTMGSDKTFAENQKYMVTLRLHPAYAHTIVEYVSMYTPYVRGKEVNPSHENHWQNVTCDGKDIIYTCTLMGREGWSKAEFNIPEPIVGYTPVSLSKKYKVEFVSGFDHAFSKTYLDKLDDSLITENWYESSDGKYYNLISKTTKFKAGYYYKNEAVLTLTEQLEKDFYKIESFPTESDLPYYGISDSISFIINGKEYKSSAHSNHVKGYVEFGKIYEKINLVRLENLVYPVAGQAVSTNVTTIDDDKYKVENVVWRKEGSSTPVTVFEAGNRYIVTIKLKAVGTYSFNLDMFKDENTVPTVINSEHADPYARKSVNVYEVNLSYLYYCPNITGNNGVIGVSGIEQPVEGEAPDKNISKWSVIYKDNKDYSVQSVKWTEDGKDTEATVFEAGKTYYAEIELKAASGKYFPSSTQQCRKIYKISVNDSKHCYISKVAPWNGESIIITAKYEPIVYIKEIPIIGYKGPAPKVKASYEGFDIDNEQCRICKTADDSERKNGIRWGKYDSVSDTFYPSKISDELTFEENNGYMVEIMVNSPDGYKFPGNLSTVKVSINGTTKNVKIRKESVDTAIVTFSSKVLEQIKEIRYTIPEPKNGEKPGNMKVETKPANAFNDILMDMDMSSSWQVSTDNTTYVDMPENGIFEEGKYYRTNAVGKHALLIIVSGILGKAYRENVASGFASDHKIYVNGKNSKDDGVYDEDGYVRFYVPRQDEIVKPDDGKQGDGNQEDGKNGKAEKKPGVGTISADGKTLTDESGKKYKIAEKISAADLKPNAKIADKKSGGKYRITKLIKDKKTGKVTGGNVEYMAPYNKNCKLISATGIVKLGGVKFKVTSIAANCAKGCKKLNKVIIGSYVSNIGKNAFSGCSKLKTVTFKGSRLKKVGANAFKGINKKATISVPKAKKKAYTKLLKGKGQAKTVKIK